MDQATHNKIVSFIWGIADDVLRDLFVRGKYRDVILPMGILRQLDAVPEPTKQNVLDTKQMLDEAGITEQRAALCAAPLLLSCYRETCAATVIFAALWNVGLDWISAPGFYTMTDCVSAMIEAE